jgi:stage II sporulation protein AB (anti-sigma F factor)
MGGEEVLNEAYLALAGSVTRARARISSFAEAAGADGECLDAIRLAASEALTNVVLHAYPEEPGEIHVTAAMAESELWVLIGDDGQGLQARSKRPGLGLGLALIAQLCDEFAIVRRSTGGTELRMLFRLPEGDDSPPGRRDTSLSGAARPRGFGPRPHAEKLGRAPA